MWGGILKGVLLSVVLTLIPNPVESTSRQRYSNVGHSNGEEAQPRGIVHPHHPEVGQRTMKTPWGRIPMVHPNLDPSQNSNTDFAFLPIEAFRYPTGENGYKKHEKGSDYLESSSPEEGSSEETYSVSKETESDEKSSRTLGTSGKDRKDEESEEIERRKEEFFGGRKREGFAVTGRPGRMRMIWQWVLPLGHNCKADIFTGLFPKTCVADASCKQTVSLNPKGQPSGEFTCTCNDEFKPDEKNANCISKTAFTDPVTSSEESSLTSAVRPDEGSKNAVKPRKRLLKVGQTCGAGSRYDCVRNATCYHWQVVEKPRNSEEFEGICKCSLGFRKTLKGNCEKYGVPSAAAVYISSHFYVCMASLFAVALWEFL